MRKFENLLIIFIVIVLALGFSLLYYAQKVDYNYSAIKALIENGQTSVELIGVVQDRIERLEKRYSGIPENEFKLLDVYPWEALNK